MSNSTNLLGAYSPYSGQINAQATSAFDEAINGFLGVTYTPVAVSAQLVAGTNYKFFCDSETSTQFPINGAAIVSVYKPLSGNAHITGIQTIH